MSTLVLRTVFKTPLPIEQTSKDKIKFAKPQVSLTVPNRDHFAQGSLTVLDIFLDASAKPKKTNLRIYSTESKASFTDKEFFSFGNGV